MLNAQYSMLNENAVYLLPGVSFSEKFFGATYYAFLLNIEH